MFDIFPSKRGRKSGKEGRQRKTLTFFVLKIDSLFPKNTNNTQASNPAKHAAGKRRCSPRRPRPSSASSTTPTQPTAQRTGPERGPSCGRSLRLRLRRLPLLPLLLSLNLLLLPKVPPLSLRHRLPLSTSKGVPLRSFTKQKSTTTWKRETSRP